MIPFSVLDLAPVTEGSDVAQALRRTRDAARHAERLGFHRFWLAEHHNMVGIASAATCVAIGFVADATSTIRVGAGGIMLPNHAPIVVAEQFGTLAALYPDRIDLGVGRAPGTDPLTARALRRYATGADTFGHDVVELRGYFADAPPDQAVRAVPGVGSHVPIWLLGSSTFSAQLAARLGLPFAFASHFAPDHLHAALGAYRAGFTPSADLDRPHVMVAMNVCAADSDREAERLFTSVQQQFLGLRRGRPGKLPPPIDAPAWSLVEAEGLARVLAHSAVGGPARVAERIAAFVEDTAADELLVTGMLYDPAAQLRSLTITAEVRAALRS